ncbi:hypothetical protein TrCOL_g5204 [Triparma columacea]|uniref:Histone deacetylase domain-containing protein n=1 Tax=Triparma columacea TaxID=722753 RepID=A0A9W7LGI8_9STRA|nr:hypothetical protein TrCOL_g5204 [Triparma columacea]
MYAALLFLIAGEFISLHHAVSCYGCKTWACSPLQKGRSSHLSQVLQSSTRRCTSLLDSSDIDSRDIEFLTTPSSLKHLSCIEKKVSRNSESSWNDQKTAAAVGAIVFATVLGYAGDIFLGPGVSFFTSSVGGGLGWKLLGGDSVRENDIPVDGGKDKKFVVDVPARLRAILNRLSLEGHIVRKVEPKIKRGEAERLVGLIHDFEYIKSLKDACDKCLETGKPRRLRQSYSRTLVDENSYEAAMDAVGLWLHATDRVLRGGGKAFVLVRPPSHHATRSRGMGGCLVNAIACAAIHALEINGIRSVGILDVDAHFGNGIANCIEENQRIRYVSLHEHNRGMSLGGSRPEYDPRSPEEADNGPSGNICNIVLKKGEGWETYEGKLMRGLAFLKDCDILIVAAGFDAVKEDNTSGLSLVPEDFRAIGHCINKTMEKKPIVFGLEGGYTHHMGGGPEGMGGVLGDCVAEFIEGLRGV